MKGIIGKPPEPGRSKEFYPDFEPANISHTGRIHVGTAGRGQRHGIDKVGDMISKQSEPRTDPMIEEPALILPFIGDNLFRFQIIGTA